MSTEKTTTQNTATENRQPDLDIIMEYGHNAHDIYKQLKEVITKQVRETTSLTLIELNVEVVDIQTQKEFD